ncbi:hypothetical protein KKA53_01915 [Candidatus Dependentiae bacterium]|nr:hypothetical protein [Candidatus Dependentiae bacterium]
MKRINHIFLLLVVGFFCSNFGGGEYSRSVAGDEAPLFELEEGARRDGNIFAATVIDEGNRANGYGLCFHNPNDDNCFKDGDPIGRVVVEAFPVGKSGTTEFRLNDIVALEVMSDPSTGARLFIDEERKKNEQYRQFLKVRLTSIDSAGKESYEDLYVDQRVSLGYKFKRGDKYAKFTVFLRRVDKIEGIKRVGKDEVATRLFGGALVGG